MTSSRRSRDYLSYLGIREQTIAVGYNSLDVGRLRAQSRQGSDPKFVDRPFLAVARLVAKKNLTAAISAFARYRQIHGGERRLQIVGYGPLEDELRNQAEALEVDGAVDFLGSQPSATVTSLMRDALALLLPSIEEQFGFVAIEAFAMGLPVIISRNAGATDDLVGNLVNGFVINPVDPDEIVAAMVLLDRDEALHKRMSNAALEASALGDVSHFVTAIRQLAGHER
jgi:glycosyltransferase involved in cell wall biosynthesis